MSVMTLLAWTVGYSFFFFTQDTRLSHRLLRRNCLQITQWKQLHEGSVFRLLNTRAQCDASKMTASVLDFIP